MSDPLPLPPQSVLGLQEDTIGAILRITGCQTHGFVLARHELSHLPTQALLTGLIIFVRVAGIHLAMTSIENEAFVSFCYLLSKFLISVPCVLNTVVFQLG